MKKALALVIVLMLLSAPARAYSAASYALFDPLTYRVLDQQDMEKRRGMASTTKLMTALIAAERYSADRIVKIKKEWCGIEGSSIYLRPGENVTVRELLYGLLLCSGNDAAVALCGLDGDPKGFIARMNERAAELSMQNTHFDNPSGLDGDTHYSTAYDMCLLAKAVLAEPTLREIVGTRSAHIGERWMNNHNRLLAQKGVLGLKTGFTKACGRCLVSAMQSNGRTLIAVTLHAPNDWDDHRTMYEKAFSGMETRTLVKAGFCGRVAVAGAGTCRIYCNEGFDFPLLADEFDTISVKMIGPRMCYPGIEAGEQWGVIRAELCGALLFETEVYYENTYELPEPGFWTRLWQNLF